MYPLMQTGMEVHIGWRHENMETNQGKGNVTYKPGAIEIRIGKQNKQMSNNKSGNYYWNFGWWRPE